jgi:ubiquinone/menaquinone biosynthesis C-methylase UbiE
MIMQDKKIQKILSDLESGYDSIAEKFSSTRAFMWRDFEFAKDMVGSGHRILDFGCGNGRLAKFLENNYQELVGVDISQKLIDAASEKYSNEKTKFIKVDLFAERLPFEDDYFDVIFSIAVFHHFPSKGYQLQMAKELYRVLRPGGKLVVSVWNLWQKIFWRYHLLAVKNKILGKSALEWRDLYIPFKSEEKVFERYHHAFRRKELKNIFLKSKFKSGSFVKSKRGNIIYVAEK